MRKTLINPFLNLQPVGEEDYESYEVNKIRENFF